MPANTPIPSPTALFPTVEAWLVDMNQRFAANRYGLIDDADFRAVFTGLSQVFADWRHLSVKRVKGATYPVPFTNNLGLVAPEYRVLGMQAVALNGTDSSSAGAGAVAPPVYYTLLRFSGGDVDALLDVEPGTTLTVKAHWVRTSGSAEEKLLSFPELAPEDYDYDAGDVVRYTFAGGETRLLMWRADSVGFSHPLPTGQDDDPIYAPFAPLSAGTTYDDADLTARIDELDSLLAAAALTAGQRAAITEANSPSAANKFATFGDLPSPNGTPAPPVGFSGFSAPRELQWLYGYPGQDRGGYEISGGTSVKRINRVTPNNWPGLYASVNDPASFIKSPRLWCKRIEVYTSWDGPAYDQRFRLRVFAYGTNAVLVDKVVAIDQTNRFYNYAADWGWPRVGGGDGDTPSYVEILPDYADCYVQINYVSGGGFVQGGLDIY